MPYIKRILILTSDFGFGHRSSANSIAKAIQLQYPNTIEPVIINPLLDEPSLFLFQKAEHDYDKTVRDYASFYRFCYEVSDTRPASSFVESTLTIALRKSIRHIIYKNQPDIIISTNQLFNAPVGSVLNNMRVPPPFFTVVTDLADVHKLWFNTNPNRFFVATDYVKNKAMENGIPSRRIIVSGIPVDPEFDTIRQSKEDIRKHLNLNPSLNTILVVGSKRVGRILEYLEVLNNITLPFQVVVIAGGDQTLYETLTQKDWDFPVCIKDYVTNMAEWMHAADILVTKAGGLILSEGMAAGLPIILIDHLAGQEEGNVKFILDNHVGLAADNPDYFITIINSWLSKDQTSVNIYSDNSKRLGHSDAAFVIANACWKGAKYNSSQITIRQRPWHVFK